MGAAGAAHHGRIAGVPDMTAKCDVLVVGLGPVGAVLAALLAQQGLSVIAIDKDAAVYPLPRAAHFDHESLVAFAT